MQDCSVSSTLAIEIHQSSPRPSISSLDKNIWTHKITHHSPNPKYTSLMQNSDCANCWQQTPSHFFFIFWMNAAFLSVESWGTNFSVISTNNFNHDIDYFSLENAFANVFCQCKQFLFRPQGIECSDKFICEGHSKNYYFILIAYRYWSSYCANDGCGGVHCHWQRIR